MNFQLGKTKRQPLKLNQNESKISSGIWSFANLPEVEIYYFFFKLRAIFSLGWMKFPNEEMYVGTSSLPLRCSHSKEKKTDLNRHGLLRILPE